MSFPNETPEYRAARDALLASEIALRRQMEAVAAQLRALPPGGKCPKTTYSTDRSRRRHEVTMQSCFAAATR